MSKPSPDSDNGTQKATESLDLEQQGRPIALDPGLPKSLGAGSALALGAFGTTLTTLALGLMEWRGVTVYNVFIGNFFFIAAFGLLITAQWELSIGNGFAYTVFSAFGLFYAGYGALLTPGFGVAEAYGGTDSAQYNNAVGFFMILWTVFVFTFLIASLASNIAYILVFLFVDLGFLTVAASYFAKADGHAASALALQKSGGVFCFLAGLVGWYIVFHLLLQDSILDLPLGDTSRYFGKKNKSKGA
ncbi:hypothetical protein N7478_009096 [Penicillium angulare]|uniref:uncharacterized protein n=1 Tax=Penicillium angulare TaxID=116970 RepID=UPI0025417DC7|nr:uncharacterized protein N7478_009096 [Penicillium angulare]KAJ5273971.1 hypothetical protein N7478_009096 [Penicillium angulare]